jgi:dTDP-4-dehydrorhamnose 3,5-epimerase
MDFEIIKTGIDDLLLIKPNVFEDGRGYFYELFNSEKYIKAGLDFNFVQDNISKSQKGTVRGLHFQVGEYTQGKLCQVIAGKVLDVAVDIRPGSKTFGKNYSIELTAENHYQLWMPPGFAHGFSVLSDDAIFLYKCTNFYNNEYERSIKYDDPELNIDWKVDSPIVSEKDKNAPTFKEYLQNI